MSSGRPRLRTGFTPACDHGATMTPRGGGRERRPRTRRAGKSRLICWGKVLRRCLSERSHKGTSDTKRCFKLPNVTLRYIMSLTGRCRKSFVGRLMNFFALKAASRRHAARPHIATADRSRLGCGDKVLEEKCVRGRSDRINFDRLPGVTLCYLMPRIDRKKQAPILIACTIFRRQACRRGLRRRSRRKPRQALAGRQRQSAAIAPWGRAMGSAWGARGTVP